MDILEGKVDAAEKGQRYGERFVALSGYLLIGTSALAFAAAGFFSYISRGRYASWLDLFSTQLPFFSILLIGILTALLGKRLLTSAQTAYTRTIPKDDLPLVEAAVKDGKPEPIDQYVRIRSLGGWAGNFTKLDITGLPLTTVFLTLVFSAVSLLPISTAGNFLDLAKLTLGAFIGSFVQRQVEQRQQQQQGSQGQGQSGTGSGASRPTLPV
jgi:hypothetical protein